MTTPERNGHSLPPFYPASLIYLDESGSRATASQFFVVAAIKLRRSGMFARTVKEVRDRTGFKGEFKFSAITRDAVPVYYALIDALEASDAHLAACVVDGSICNPFKGRSAWEAHAEIAAQLLVGCINKREVVSILLDGISTPPGCAFDDRVRELVNKRLNSTSVVTAACLDSASNDVLQVADMVAGAILFERRQRLGTGPRPNEHKAKVSARLGAAFACVGMRDGRSTRVNIATYRPRSQSAASGVTLTVVRPDRAS